MALDAAYTILQSLIDVLIQIAAVIVDIGVVDDQLHRIAEVVTPGASCPT